MEAKEIREGVWLKWKDNQQIFDVTIGIMLQGHFWTHISKGDIIPIPLTPELLVKCGFEKDEDTSKHQCWHLRLGYNDWDQDFFLQLTDPVDEIDMCIVYSRDVPESSCQILHFPKYLHQLQNLYFSLTGAELVVNL